MGVSLHGLRWKIAAAAVLKSSAARAARIPGARAGLDTVAQRLAPEGEQSGSYRGLAAGLLQDAIAEEPDAQALTYDPVAGVIPGPETESAPDLSVLRIQAEQDPSAANFIALAAAYRKSYIADFAASAEAYERAFEANPRDLRAIEGVLVSGARSHYDWPRIWRYARTLIPRRGPLHASAPLWATVEPLFQQNPAPEEVWRAAALADEDLDRIRSLHQLLIETLAARLQFLGAFRAGARLRRVMAENRVKELAGIPMESALWLKHLLGAYASLEEHQRLAKTVRRPPVDTTLPGAARQVEKLRADVALFHGDIRPLQRHAVARSEEVLAAGLASPGEKTMRELVAGKRVAVVGPAAGQENHGELIDSHDVVVRTNLRKPLDPEAATRIGSRTEISYYAGLDLVRHYQDVEQLVSGGEVRLAVTRPHCLPAFKELPEWLRIPYFEFGLYFRGAPMGIQRILYDLLQFAPAEISLFHSDFYAGHQVVAAGYRDDAIRFGPHSQANDPVVMHDLSFEFRFTQRLARAELVTPHGTAAEVLKLDEEEYLNRLEERSHLARE